MVGRGRNGPFLFPCLFCIFSVLLKRNRGCRVMTFFYPIAPKKHLPQNSVLFGMDSSAGDVFFLLLILFFGRKKPLAADF